MAESRTGAITWFEVLGSDTEKLRAFYADLFGWRFETDKDMDYGMVPPSNGSIPGGVGAAHPEGGAEAAGGWTTFYVEVENVQTSIEQALAGGGRLLMPPTSLPDTTIAVIADPEGHPIGLSASS